MSVVSNIELICDICSKAADVSLFEHQGRDLLRAYARKDGWKHRRQIKEGKTFYIDICPDHLR